MKATSKTPKSSKPLQPVKGGYLHDRYVDRNIVTVNTMKEKFEPTDRSPVRQHFKMAGGCD